METITLQVLITDDEPGMRLGAQRVLRPFRAPLPDIDAEAVFAVDLAGDGEETYARTAEKTYDLMLLDYKLPDTTGLDILERLRVEQPDLLIVMITAYASLEVAVSATKNGAFDFLAKPFAPDELKSVVGKAARACLMARQARTLAEEKRRMRFEFLSVLAHELKAPLAAVENYLRIMKDHTAGEELAAYDTMIGRSLARLDGMRKMIFDLLDLTRIESGQKKREFKKVNAIEAARLAIENAQLDAERRGIAVKLDAPEMVELTADRSELEIVFNNLVSNAVKYNREGGRVDIRVAREGDHARIRVADTGIGMTPDEKAKLFGEFVRIKNEKTLNIPGSGLGLSTLRKLVNLYNGTIQVESEPDQGSVFEVTLQDQGAGAESSGKA